MYITRQGVAAAAALLGSCLASMLSLLTLESVSGTRVWALVAFSAALPLLSFGISVELIEPSIRPRGSYHIVLMVIGAACGIAGICFSVLYLSLVAAVVFIVCSLTVVALSWFVAQQGAPADGSASRPRR